MRSIDISRFAQGGIIREESFRQAVEDFDWKQYQGKRVLIQGCAQIPIPMWAYMMVAAKLAQYAESINYGEVTKPFPIFDRSNNKVVREKT
jgi:hypothetical protein